MLKRTNHSAAATKTRSRLKTRVGVTDIFDGTDKLCAERFGFKTAGGKVTSHLAANYDKVVSLVTDLTYAKGLSTIGAAVFATLSGQYYKWVEDEDVLYYIDTFSSEYPFAVEAHSDNQPVGLVFGGKRAGILHQPQDVTCGIDYGLYCGAFHYGRVFARDIDDPYLIRWSAHDVTDWTQGSDKGGSIRLDSFGGKVLDILSFGKELLIVREYALCVMHALGDEREFSVEQSAAHNLPTVTPYSTVICGGQLWFHTAEGLYSFNGNTLSCKPLPGYRFNYKVRQASSVGCRCIYLDLYDRDNISTRCLLEYDVQEDVFTFLGNHYHHVFEIDENVYVFRRNTSFKMEKGIKNDDYFWRSKKTDFGTGKCKTLKRLIAEGEGDLTFEIDCDGRKHTVEGFGSIAVGERAHSFEFTVKGAGSLSRLAAEWEVNA